MSFNNIDNLQLGTLLQIVFSNGVRNQISQDFRDFEMIKRARVGNSAARELRFMFQTGYGPAAIQYRDPGTSGRSFPTAQQAQISEKTAKFKELNATIELEYNLWDRARKSPEKYAEPLALEIDSKTSASKRRIAADLYGDGTGVIGTASSAADTTGANGYVDVTLSTSDTARGHIGFFEYGDLLLPYNSNGTADNPTVTGTFYAWRVDTKNRDTNVVRLSAVNAAGTVLALTASSIDSGDVFYRVGQPTIPDLTASITDYGTATEVIAGMESLTANDGRTIHSIVMSGANAGTRTDAGGNAIDVKYIQKCLDSTKVAVGQDRYKYKMMSMSPETHASLIESRETDRRFQTVEDNKRGIKYFAYVHGNDTVETYTSEYCPQKRIYMLPEAKSSEKVIEFWGSDFEPVRAQGGDEFHLKPGSSGGHVNTVVSYLQSIGLILCKHPASIGVIHNFTNA